MVYEGQELAGIRKAHVEDIVMVGPDELSTVIWYQENIVCRAAAIM